MKIVIKPCHQQFFDENDAVVTWIEHVRVEGDDGRCANSGRGFESVSDRMMFVEGLLMGLRSAGVDGVRVLYDGPVASPSFAAPCRLHHAEVYSDGAVFYVIEDEQGQLRVDEASNLHTMASVDATFHDESQWQRAILSSWDDEALCAHYDGNAVHARIYVWVGYGAPAASVAS
jgi:hypothetical protein